MNRMDEAVEFLRRASDGLPERAMVHYNYGLAAQSLEMANRLLEISPGHPQGQRLKAAAEAALRRQRAGIPGYRRRPTMRMQ